jgi:N-methylhydantoinase B
MAIERQYRMLARGGGLLQLRSDRSEHAPWGLEGGGPGAVSRNTLLDEGDGSRELPNKVTMELAYGTAVRHQMAGAGGHGDPLAREVNQVLEDVLDERISAGHARQNYGVVIRNGAVDRDATLALRAGRRGAADRTHRIERYLHDRGRAEAPGVPGLQDPL